MRIRNILLTAAATGAMIAALAPAVNAQEAVRRTLAQDATLAPIGKAPVEKPRHLVYLATPGGSGNGSLKSGGWGYIILDADRKYDFIKRVQDGWDVPGTETSPNVTGIAASVATNLLYIQTRSSVKAYDLGTDKLAWDKVYGNGHMDMTKGRRADGVSECCERGELTPDGLTMVVGANHSNKWFIVDAKSGELKGQIDTPMTPCSHNMSLSPDGKLAVLGDDCGEPSNVMSVADVGTRKVLRTITFSDAIRPLVISADGKKVYANVDNLLGFEIGDTTTGKMVKRVEAPAELWKAKWGDPNSHFFGHGCPTHGIALTPDESEIWIDNNITDANGKYGVAVWDNTGDTPVYDAKKSFETDASSGWITMGLDGTPYGLRAYLGSGDVVDVKTHSVIALERDEYGNRIGSEKQLELAALNGKIIQAESQFGGGRPADVAARLASNKSASN